MYVHLGKAKRGTRVYSLCLYEIHLYSVVALEDARFLGPLAINMLLDERIVFL